MTAAEVAFWILVFCPIYSMGLYPLLMLMLGRIVRRRFIREPITPPVSLIIAAFNEEKAIAAKLENSLALDYPHDRLEILVASDASTDRTDDLVRAFESRGVRLLRFEGGLGKSAMLNAAAANAAGDILCFSDATGMWSAESVRAMAAHFADPRVGCVSGWVKYRYGNSVTAQGFGVYQRFVMALRRAEAAFGAGVNAPGSIHAVRRSAFVPSPPDTFMDMADPFHTACQGLRTTFEESAVSVEESRTRPKDEFQARVRINLRSWRFMFYALTRFPLLRSPMYCFQLVSHKFLRWLIGPSLIPILALNIVLAGERPIYRVTLAMQAAFYLLTIAGFVSDRLGVRLRGLSGLVFFNAVNWAYVVALVKYLAGRRARRWVPSR